MERSEVIRRLRSFLEFSAEDSMIAERFGGEDEGLKYIKEVIEPGLKLLDELEEVEIIRIGSQVVQQSPTHPDVYKAYRLNVGSRGFYRMGSRDGCIQAANEVESTAGVRAKTAKNEEETLEDKINNVREMAAEALEKLAPKKRKRSIPKRRKGGVIAGSKL